MKRTIKVNEAFAYFGPQVCGDKVRGFLTVGYDVLRAEIGEIYQGKPKSIILHEFGQIDIDESKFIKNFEEPGFEIVSTDSGYNCDVILKTNFPRINSSYVVSKYHYQNIEIILYTYKVNVCFEKESRVVSNLQLLNNRSLRDMTSDFVDAYAPNNFVNEFINSNGKPELIKSLHNLLSNKIRSKELFDSLDNLRDVHRIMDS